MNKAIEDFSVKDLKGFLDSQGINYTGYTEKEELVKLALGELEPSTLKGTDKFMQGQFGAASALAAEFELLVRSWSVKELKAHLTKIGIDFSAAIEKEDLVALALEGRTDKKHSLNADSEPSDNVLEC